MSNGTTAGHWALGGGIGTISAVNADSYDEDGKPIPQVYHARTRRERHEELIAYAVKGALAQARRAFDITGGKGRNAFILESIEGGKHLGRYSFIGVQPRAGNWEQVTWWLERASFAIRPAPCFAVSGSQFHGSRRVESSDSPEW